jgi:bifunctional UDP-N-acetylglucosamine pyrophosphorylase/glucosamine-1-phosphate N-acetyltransferase
MSMTKDDRRELARRWQEAGVVLQDPDSLYAEEGVTIGAGTVIGPNVQLRGKTTIGKDCRIDGSAFLTDAELGDRVHLRFSVVVSEAKIGSEAVIGPFAHLRPGTSLGERVHIGNFVETKKAVVGEGTKANHLTYLGDVTIGRDTNIGAGTITCNYDGVNKNKTIIEDGAFIGSDTQLVAPVRIGKGAYVGAGSTITKDVPAEALALSRTPQKIIEGWATRKKTK